MADGSDDPRDVVLYYRVLEAGYDCAFGSRFMPGAVVHDYPRFKLGDQPDRQRRHPHPLPPRLQRHDERVQGLSPRGDRERAPAALAPLQPDGRAAAEGDHARLLLRDRPDLLDQPRGRQVEAAAQRDGQPLPVHRALRVPRVPPQPRRLPARRRDRARAPGAPRGARGRRPSTRASCAAASAATATTADDQAEPAAPAPRLGRRLGDRARRRRVVGVQAGRAEVPRRALGGYLWLVGALGVYALALAARGWRWHRIMRLAEIPHRRADAYRLTLVGYMGNNVLPARGGEVLRIAILGSRTTAKRRTILGSIIAERILDAAVLAALFAVLTWFGVAHAPVGQWPASVAAGRARARRRSRSPATSRCAGAGTSSASTRRSARSRARSRCSRTPRACCWPRCRR